MASKAMRLRMEKLGRPCHCADGKWRTPLQARYWELGWAEARRIFLPMKAQARKSFFEGIMTRYKMDSGS